MLKMHPSVTADAVFEMAERDENEGVCIACGEESGPGTCEPDARKYPCEACGEDEVYGAQELLLYLVA